MKKKAFTSLQHLTVITVSRWLASVAHESYLNKFPILTIYNGIDVTVFKPTPSDFREKHKLSNKFLILGVASYWDERKGLIDFLHLSALIAGDCAIVLVGLTENQIKTLPDNIVGVPRTDSMAQLAELYSVADVLVNCSIEETFGMVVAEAMACGTPAIVYNSTACPEVIDENTGAIVSPNDIEGIFQAITTIKKNGKLYYKEKCIQRILNKFTQDSMSDKYLEIYQDVMTFVPFVRH